MASDRRNFLKKAGAVAGTITIAGCSDGEQTNNNGSGEDSQTETSSVDGDATDETFVYSRANYISTLDFMTAKGVSNDNIKVLGLVYDQLMEFEPGKTSLQEGLATDYSIDGTTFKFTLRQDVKFSDGTEFTADDFVATYRRYTDPDYEYFIEKVSNGSQNGYADFTFGMVDNVEKTGKYSLTIELTKKFAPFLRNLAMWSGSVLSKKAIESETNMSNAAVGTGPFTIDRLDETNQRVYLKANEDWFGDGPYVSQVVINTINNNSTRVQSLTKGESHLIDGLTPTTAEQIKSTSGIELLQQPGGNVGNLAMNLETFEPFRNLKVRQAIKYAVDTKSMVEEIYKGYATIGTQPIPPSELGFNKNLEPYPHDPDKAKSLLEKAGYGDGFSVELAIFQNPRGYHPAPVQTAQVVRTNLDEIGINVNINQMPFGDWFTYCRQGKHEFCQSGWVTDNTDPDNILATLLDPGIPESEFPTDKNWVSRDTEGYNAFDFTAWFDEKFVTNLRKGAGTYDNSTRRTLYEEANKIAHEKGGWVTYGYQDSLHGVSKQVSDYHPAAVIDENLQTVKLQE